MSQRVVGGPEAPSNYLPSDCKYHQIRTIRLPLKVVGGSRATWTSQMPKMTAEYPKREDVVSTGSMFWYFGRSRYFPQGPARVPLRNSGSDSTMALLSGPSGFRNCT